MTRSERANAKKGRMGELLKLARGHLTVGSPGPAWRALNEAYTLVKDIATLERYDTDEDHRLALVTQMKNGYH